MKRGFVVGLEGRCCGALCGSREEEISARRNSSPSLAAAHNLWLDLSVSAEPGPKAMWFPGVTTSLCLWKAK